MILKIQMTTRRIGLALAALSVLAILSFACGDDDDGTTASPSGSGQASETPDGSTIDPSSTPGPSSTGEAGELEELVQAWLDGVNAKVAYDYQSNFGQHPDGIYTTYFLDGNDRHDWYNEGSGFETTVVSLITPEQAYVCTLTPAFPTCSEAPEVEAQSARAVFLIIIQTMQLVAAGIDGASVEALPDEEIADVQGHCYELSSAERISAGPPGTELLKFCFSDAGALLSFNHDTAFEDETLPAGDLDLLATEVGDPAPGDFEPPAEVIS
jgi:hypothetical protein